MVALYGVVTLGVLRPQVRGDRGTTGEANAANANDCVPAWVVDTDAERDEKPEGRQDEQHQGRDTRLYAPRFPLIVCAVEVEESHLLLSSYPSGIVVCG